ncbi:short patch repair protein [Streptomyces lividans TK24]|uniref:Uncharacterized protein n=1 Tax=Streptomyces lividans TK24 TaxID=457428 RepID=A0ABX6TPQ6_STRLI|nr:short patch repair protein [Streptomyces lividans TK24]QNR95632.1 Hypothetical protein SLIV_23338 [Streptomyces lividans TK24]QSJ11171.1 Hypothetical protein SLIVDG2_23338 [Streptomyces lividans]QTD72081.1 Hypothetical protein SLIVYQS_23338 [Streptomyces lividans TK24] [Streptomyces lividans]
MNVSPGRRDDQTLAGPGWTVLRFWRHEVPEASRVGESLTEALFPDPGIHTGRALKGPIPAGWSTGPLPLKSPKTRLPPVPRLASATSSTPLVARPAVHAPLLEDGPGKNR